jgi:membrane protease YdiL (CAAX protease family)
MEPTDRETPQEAEKRPIPPAAEVTMDRAAPSTSSPSLASLDSQPFETTMLLRVLMGPQGLRAGWSVLLFEVLTLFAASIMGLIFLRLNLIDLKADFSPKETFFSELVQVLAIMAAAAIVALIERRRGNLLAFNLLGPRRLPHFFEGLAAGFVALSLLIGALHWGGWLQFGPTALSGRQIFTYAGVWGAAFLLVGCAEEGMCRCYLLFTLARGLNFWWALGTVGAICLVLLLWGSGDSIRGVYAVAAVGLVPCLLLHLNKAGSSGFWQAGWVTSTVFGFVHTGNTGENWIGIIATAAIGFVFVVSVRVTGSAWWAIGCHAAWDWAETYFYGAADSGNVAVGHYLSVTPAGPVLWSGGTDGPEGSVLVLAAVLLLLLLLVAVYGRRSHASLAASAAAAQIAG